MRPRVWLSLLAVALSVASSPVVCEADAQFDAQWRTANGHYKRALQASSLGRQEQTLAALARFRASWSSFQAAYTRRPPAPYVTDRAWKADVGAVTAWAQAADRLARMGDMHHAHETLEQVRLRWMAVRVRNGVVDFGDRLTSFHDPMERVTLAVKGRTPATLRGEQLEAVRRAMPLLKVRWARVAGWQGAVGGTARAALIEQLGMAIDELDAAVASSDRAGIISSGSRLKPLFAKLYMQFG